MERNKLDKMKDKILMFEHAGSGNHGCEAIVRSTYKILGKNNYCLQTFNASEDAKFGLDDFVKLSEIKEKKVSTRSLRVIFYRIKSRVTGVDYDTLTSCYKYKNILKHCKLALSIGGDNYCYNGIIISMNEKLRLFSYKKIPTVLWGCSIDREHLSGIVKKDLKKYSLITVRETISQEILSELGLIENVVLCSDPAFTLDRQRTNWNDDVFNNHQVIGINVSDFMKFYNAYPDATYKNFYNLIDYILKNTDNYMALIPHVRQGENDDLVPIKKLADEFNNPRILVVDDDYNCMQLKDIIARCKLFIGCRTHSTIAAYSSCVPTLVVGYSVKARGICKDIFGSYDGLLVDAREFNDDHNLTNAFIEFSNREDELRTRLQNFMPEYIKRAYKAGEELKKRFNI